ncbi:MAG: hypothetical protein V7711_09425 [Pseudomonadales bacterium]
MSPESMYPWILAVVVISLMLAPVVWMLPSPRQKQLTRLRAHALQLGVRPELRKPPQELAHLVGSQVMRYVLERNDLSPRLRNKLLRWVILRRIDENNSNGFSTTQAHLLSSELELMLADLPETVMMIELIGGSARIYWREQGTEATVDTLAQTMQTLLEAQLITV